MDANGNGQESDAPMEIGNEHDIDDSLAGQIINSSDGLPNIHPNFSELELHPATDIGKSPQGEIRTLDELIHDEDLPTSLIVTNLGSSVFESEEQKVGNWIYFETFLETCHVSSEFSSNCKVCMITFAFTSGTAGANVSSIWRTCNIPILSQL